MSICKSYNKNTGVYYTYEITYTWDDELRKKVQHKKCVGKFDPVTGELVPNGKVGRPLGSGAPRQAQASAERSSEGAREKIGNVSDEDLKALHDLCDNVSAVLTVLSSQLESMTAQFNDLKGRLEEMERQEKQLET
ncbi:MAG: hypothetical protein LUD51_02070 [Clostridia bacterium]|nr:hypothetical protein [Clostridia bacterium]